MNRAELIQQLADRFPSLQLKDTDIAVRVILDVLSYALSKGDRAEIRGFGSFQLNYRPPRKGRNPKTGISVNVPAKHTPHFKPGLELRCRVNAQFTKSKK